MSDTRGAWLKRNSIDYDETRTAARLKFEIDDRVQLSNKGIQQGLAWEVKGREIRTGWVAGFPRNEHQIKVKRNGLKRVESFHIDLWEKGA